MNFLTPFYAIAALAIAGPILLHLVRRQPKDRMEFSSLLFLPESPPKMTRNSRIEHWLLLILRSLVILLIAMAFARPYWNESVDNLGAVTSGKRTCLLIDQSASMRRDGLWGDVIRKAHEVIDAANPTDVMAVYAFDRELQAPLSLSEAQGIPVGRRATAAKSAMESIRPTWSSADLGMALSSCLGALQSQATEMDGAASHLAEIILISDLAEGSEIEALTNNQWPEDTVVRTIRATPSKSGNAYFSVLDSANSTVDNAENSSDWRIRVSNTKSSKTENFTLVWLDHENKPIDSTSNSFTVAAGSHRVVKLSAPPTHAQAIELTGDEASFDNRRYSVVAPLERKSIFVIEENSIVPEDSLAYFLELLPFQESQYVIDVQRRDPGSLWGSEQDSLPAWVVLSHSATVSDADQCRKVLEAGGYVTIVLDGAADKPVVDGTTAGEYMQKLTTQCAEVDIGNVSEGRPKEFAMLERFDFSHPVLAPLADPQFNDFSRIRFWQYRRVEPVDLEGWRVLAWFGSDAPAIMERPVGQGRLLLMTFGWQPTQSQLALSSKFVPMMAGIAARAIPKPPIPRNGVTGQGRYAEPGIYPVEDTNATDKKIAVNVPASESLTEPMDPSQLSRYGVRLASDIPPEPVANQLRRKMVAAELESRQSWWWWLVSACLVAVGLESMLCWRRNDK